MNLSLKRKKPDQTPNALGEANSAPADSASARQILEADLTGKVIAAAIILCLVCGPLGLLLAVSASGGSGAPAADGDGPVDLATPTQAGDYAVRVVEAWAGATRDSDDALTQLIPSAPATTTQKPLKISDLSVASIKQADDAWAVTVSGRVGTTLRYFVVPVDVDQQTVTALSLPAPVAAPQTATVGDLDYGSAISATSPITKTVGEFLSAYLAGAGDLTRYTTPGTTLAPVAPALAAKVDVTDVRLAADSDVDADQTPADGVQVDVLVAAALTLASDRTLQTTYTLQLTGRADRWEITAIKPAPTVRPSQPTTTGTEPATPSTTPSTGTTNPTSQE